MPSAFVSSMTAPVGNIGTKLEAGDAGGQRPSVSGLYDKLGTGKFAALDTNRTVESSTAPTSFRSRWHAAMKPSFDVSRGTNNINNLEEETGSITVRNRTQYALIPNKLQIACGAHSTAGQRNQIRAMETQPPMQTTCTASNRCPRELERNGTAEVTPGTSTALSTTDLPGAGRRGIRESRNSQQNNASTELPANTDRKERDSLTTNPTEPQIAAAALSQATEPSLPGADAHGLSIPTQPVSTAPVVLPKGGAGAGAQDMTVDSRTSMRTAAQDVAPSNLSPVSLGKAADPGDNLHEVSLSADGSSDSATLGTREVETLRTGRESSGNHSGSIATADHFTSPKIPTGEVSFAPSRDSESEVNKPSAAQVQAISRETAESPLQQKRTHSTGRESTSTTAMGTAQAATIEGTDTAIRMQTAEHRPTYPVEDRTIGPTSSPSSTQDAFAVLDREASVGNPTWTHAAGQHAEAGFRDPQLGWVGVRADLNASGIRATLVPSSVDAAQALGGHLAGLSSHLADEHTPVASLSMASPGESGADGLGQHMQQGTEGHDRGGGSQESATISRTSSTLEPNQATTAINADASASFEAQAYVGELRGTLISVVA